MASDHDTEHDWYRRNEGKTLVRLSLSPNDGHDDVLMKQLKLSDGREEELLQFVLDETSRTSTTPAAIAAAIDKFGIQEKYLMNIGPKKGVIMCKLIAKVEPELMVELGGYIGYSAIVLGDACRKAGCRRYISIECNDKFAKISKQLVELAGLSDVVEIRVGISHEVLEKLKKEVDASEERAQKIELLFLDHFKGAYKHDLMVCEQLQLVGPGSIIAADNVIHPGVPGYREYVSGKVALKKGPAVNPSLEKAEMKHLNEKNWYLKSSERSKTPMTGVIGDPDLIYESRIIRSYEPDGTEDGIEISTCIAKSLSGEPPAEEI